MVCGSAREIPEKAVFRQVDRLREPCCHHSRIHMQEAMRVRVCMSIARTSYSLLLSHEHQLGSLGSKSSACTVCSTPSLSCSNTETSPYPCSVKKALAVANGAWHTPY